MALLLIIVGEKKGPEKKPKRAHVGLTFFVRKVKEVPRPLLLAEIEQKGRFSVRT